MSPVPRFLPALLCALLLAACSAPPAPRGASPFDERALDREIAALHSEDQRSRARAEDSLKRMGPRVCRVLSREVATRVDEAETGPGFVCVLRMLGALGGVEAGRPLSQAARKRALEPAVRIEAVRALGTLGVPEGRDALRECAREDEPVPLRLAALAALSAFAQGPEVRGDLLRHLALGSPPVRRSAARSLLSCDEAEVRAAFRLRLADGSPELRLLAASYFRLHPDPGAAPLLRQLASKDGDLRVAMAAGKALEALEQR